MQVNHTMWEHLTTNFCHQRFVAPDHCIVSFVRSTKTGLRRNISCHKNNNNHQKNCGKNRLKLILRKNHELQTAGRQKHPDSWKIFWQGERMCAEAIRGISFSRLHRSPHDNKQALQGQIREVERMRMYFRKRKFETTSNIWQLPWDSLQLEKVSLAWKHLQHLWQLLI